MIENFLENQKPKKTLFKKKKLLFFIGLPLLIIIVFGALGYFLLYIPAMQMKAQGQRLVFQGKQLVASFKLNDIDLVKKDFATLEKEYAQFGSDAKKLYWLKIIPFGGVYVSDLSSGLEAGDEMLKSMRIALDAIAPYADLIGFKKDTAGFLEQSADERIQTAVLTLDKVVEKTDDIALHIDRAREKLDQINETRYPEKLREIEVRGLLTEAKKQFDTVASFFVDAKPFIKNLPNILGVNEEKTYLVLFQNDKELRPTGGFLTAYAIFKVRNGKFTVSISEDIYSLDESIPSHPKAPREIVTYHKGVSTFNIRDSNLSPDFPTSLTLFNELYEKSRKKVEYDGVITVDTTVLVDTLEVLGDTEADGVVFSSKDDTRCDCPQVIYQLFDIVDRPVNYVKTNRKGILGDLLYVIMQKALGSSPSQYWGRLSQDLLKNLQEKHMLLYFADHQIQDSVEKINFAGQLREYSGDYLHINDTNFAGAKSNLFVTHKVISDTQIDPNGKVKRTLTIEYKNPHKHSDCDLERGGLCLNATLRNWVRVYVPKGSKLVDFQGSEKKTQTYEDLGKTVFEGYVEVKPLGKSTVVVTYTLPFDVRENEYHLLIQKQPGTNAHDYMVSISGRQKETFKLMQDKEILTQK